MTKSETLLYIFESLMLGEAINASEYTLKYKISKPTFFRYIKTLKKFFKERFNKSLVYDYKNKEYKIR